MAFVFTACSVYTKPQKVDDYLYTIEYSKYDFDRLSRVVDDLFYGKRKLPSPACSAIRCNSLFGRNFDWFYDEMPEFVITVTPAEGRYASIGMAAPISLLKDRQVGGLWGSVVLDLLPVFTVDGINEKGVACCVNVTPQCDCGCTVGTNPDKARMYSALFVRYVLDNAASAEEAVRLLDERNIYTSVAYGLKEDYHFLIADSSSTYVVEFVDNKPVVLEGRDIITNFNLAVEPTSHAMGLERYDILAASRDRAGTPEGMFKVLRSVWFSGMYDETLSPPWNSELCSSNDDYGLTVQDIISAPEKFDAAFEKEREKFRSRSRKKGDTWHSVHTSIYNLGTRTLTVYTQEGENKNSFTLR